MQHFNGLSVAKLGQLCRDRKKSSTHEPYCFELFRRAIVEDEQASWSEIVESYNKLIISWILKMGASDQHMIEDCQQDAFAKFYIYYTTEKLSNAKGLASILDYLHSTTISAVQEFRRKEPAWLSGELVDEEMTVGAISFGDSIDAITFLNAVRSLCKDAKEKVVVEMLFCQGLKPQQICKDRPDLFENAKQVSRVKENLVKRLNRHPKIKAMAEKS